MGQRHQIYIKLPKALGIAGLHHQWLFGANAVTTLARVLNFYTKQGDCGPLTEDLSYGKRRQVEAVRSLYSLDQETGYWHYVHNLHDAEETYAERDPNYVNPPEVIDPRNGDNNDGITIIDVSKGDFRYAFMSIGHLEGEVDPKPLTILTAEEYLNCYYPNYLFSKKLNSATRKKAETAIKYIERNAKVLTLAEVKKMFPAMFKKQKGGL